MRIRYRTIGPRGIWYQEFDGQLPKTRQEALIYLVDNCQQYFGPQFTRYESIVISLMKGSESMVNITVDPLAWLHQKAGSGAAQAA